MPELPVLTVSELTLQLKNVIEQSFPVVCVVGELSNCTRAGSGHVYLTLKDDQSQLRGVIWRTTAQKLRFDLHDGLEVVAVGRLELYAARGSYQLIVEQLMPQGIGALELAFRQLQEKLAAEGLFAPDRKRPLPRFPRRIALVTSPTGAAVRDLLQVITRRWPAARVVILPVPVQGEGAAVKIADGITEAARLTEIDVIVTGRGGGSLEDLWAFNEEIVARAIFASPVPVVSAVGHEIDVSIADLVADRRALTPSEAGELVVPHQDEVRAELRRLERCLEQSLRERARRARMRLDHLATHRVFARPLERLHDLAQQLDELETRQRLGIRHVLSEARQHVARFASALDALSPLGVLERGFSLTQLRGAIVTDARTLQPGDEIVTRLHRGQVRSRVESVEPAAEPSPASRRRTDD